MVNTHGLTHDEMILPDTLDVQDGRMVHSEVDKPTFKGYWHRETIFGCDTSEERHKCLFSDEKVIHCAHPGSSVACL